MVKIQVNLYITHCLEHLPHFRALKTLTEQESDGVSVGRNSCKIFC